jgi:hypothetical protein
MRPKFDFAWDENEMDLTADLSPYLYLHSRMYPGQWMGHPEESTQLL